LKQFPRSALGFRRGKSVREARHERPTVETKERSRPCAVGRLGTIERRRTVTVFVKPLLERLFF